MTIQNLGRLAVAAVAIAIAVAPAPADEGLSTQYTVMVGHLDVGGNADQARDHLQRYQRHPV